jgi:hypothetical protein
MAEYAPYPIFIGYTFVSTGTFFIHSLLIPTIGAEIDKTINDFIQLLASVDEKKLNIVPFKDSWTAGQLAQHVLLSVSGFTELVYGPVKETERAPDLGIETIRRIFLDFTIKLKSPDFILPPVMDYRKAEQMAILEQKKILLIQASETMDLTKTCTGFELPKMGLLTRLEALYFIMCHTQRHTHQLRNICQQLNKN